MISLKNSVDQVFGHNKAGMTSLLHNVWSLTWGYAMAKIDSNNWGYLKRWEPGRAEDENFNFQINLSLAYLLLGWQDSESRVCGLVFSSWWQSSRKELSKRVIILEEPRRGMVISDLALHESHHWFCHILLPKTFTILSRSKGRGYTFHL